MTSNGSVFGDDTWSDEQWHGLLSRLVKDGLLSWKDVSALTLGHMNPSQVGTSLASSDGFKRRYGKGQVMPLVMKWFYSQDGRCQDCGSRLELQADHINPRQSFRDKLDADFIENMTLRCRRCNVIRRPSHEQGGKTHLTAEAALMWIMQTLRPRTQIDFVRMCRLYGMTMADVRMQEGWAMAHWLNKMGDELYALDAEHKVCNVLLWPDGGVTRMWDGDPVPKLDKAQLIAKRVRPDMQIALVCAVDRVIGEAAAVQILRYRVGSLPFSHYFPNQDAEILAIQYTPPKREKGTGLPRDIESETLSTEDSELNEVQETAEEALEEAGLSGVRGATIRPLPPRGFKVIQHILLTADQSVRVTWHQQDKAKSHVMAPLSRFHGGTKKLCSLSATEIEAASFAVTISD